MWACCLQEVKNNEKFLNCQPQKVVTFTYRRWLFMGGSSCKALTVKDLLFWREQSLLRSS